MLKSELEEISQNPALASVEVQTARLEPAVSVVMPVYNEGQRIKAALEGIIRRLDTIFSEFELVIVDDGSTDGTFEVASSIQDNRVKVVGYKQNKGKGYASIWGYKYTTSDIIVFADGDVEAVPFDFRAYLEAINNSDIVIASKRAPNSHVLAGVKRKFLSIAFNSLVRLSLSLPTTDTQVGFKLFKRQVLGRILPLLCVKRYAFDVEVLLVANLLHYKIVELPISVTLNSDFGSRHIMRMLLDLIGISYRFRIRRWYQFNIDNLQPKYNPIIALT